jgi:hypothetical protein
MSDRSKTLNGEKNKHPFHKKIGDYLLKHVQNVDFVIDPACGGQQNISLFLSEVKSYETEICNVDFMMIKDNKIKIIIEIEETNIKPTQILGKLMTSALAKYYIHGNYNNEKTPMADNVCFIQILDTKILPDKSKKRDQWRNIELAVAHILPSLKTNIKVYKLFYGSLKDNDMIDLYEIARFINEELAK